MQVRFQNSPKETATMSTKETRDNFLIPEREMTFSIFDPNSKSFVTKKVQLPSLEVQGGIVKPSTGGNTPEANQKETRSTLLPSRRMLLD